MNAPVTIPADAAPAAACDIDPADPRARILAALHHRAGKEAATPAATPLTSEEAAALLPAVLDLARAALPDDAARAAQTAFGRDLQVRFLENLSIAGSVRSAAAAAGVSHQTAYRARRSCAVFRMGWDAALLHARASAVDTLACRAIDGVEEQVFYHGEVVATRRRYSDRLLLAHLARLDRAAEQDPRANPFTADWDGAVARFLAGDLAPPEQAAAQGEDFSSEPCNRRSMSPDPLGDKAGRAGRNPAGQGEPHFGAQWTDADLDAEMERERPYDAPPPEALGDRAEVMDCQREAFRFGDDAWWRYGADFQPFVQGPRGNWLTEEELDRTLFGHSAAAAGPAAEPGRISRAVPDERTADE